MCGRYTLAHSTEDILARFRVRDLELPIAARFNIAPSNWVPIIIANQMEGGRRIEAARWGFVAAWSRDAKPMINARSESIAVKPFFRTAFRARRCIVPADSFYEWTGDGKARKPWRVHLKDKSLMGFAGLFEDWSSRDGDEIRTCAIITVPANRVMAQFHDRMPAIIPHHLEGRWLDPTNKNLPELESILKPYPDDQIVCHRVSTQVNGTAIDGRQLIAPIDPLQEQADEEAHSLAAKEIARQLKETGNKSATKPKKEKPQDSGQLSLFDQFPQ
ncbi:MAG: SOS response-associated peptidase [Cyanobacteria bacterium PR.023]|nr:SOS response-associated peptidase [Cyanobacteria bacterium PR.023]